MKMKSSVHAKVGGGQPWREGGRGGLKHPTELPHGEVRGCLACFRQVAEGATVSGTIPAPLFPNLLPLFHWHVSRCTCFHPNLICSLKSI